MGPRQARDKAPASGRLVFSGVGAAPGQGNQRSPEPHWRQLLLPSGAVCRVFMG